MYFVHCNYSEHVHTQLLTLQSCYFSWLDNITNAYLCKFTHNISNTIFHWSKNEWFDCTLFSFYIYACICYIVQCSSLSYLYMYSTIFFLFYNSCHFNIAFHANIKIVFVCHAFSHSLCLLPSPFIKRCIFTYFCLINNTAPSFLIWF